MNKPLLTVLFIFLFGSLFAQTDTISNGYEWPYSMPILGKKAAERGYKIQLPYGLNVNYVYNRVDLEISEFQMYIGDSPDGPINQLISDNLTLENLNFTNTIARTSGMNLRADVWVLPFFNVYGIYANNNGSTEVSLQPEWFDDEGNLVLSLPEVSSTVNLTATSFGVGSTIVGKLYDHYFWSVDGNMTWSQSDLLDDVVHFGVISARVGDRIQLAQGKMMLALYVGGMYRDSFDNAGNFGAVAIGEALPNLGDELFPAIDERIDANNDKIAELNPNNPIDRVQIGVLEKYNETLRGIETAMENVLSSDVNYGIKKEIINNWSVQFGFNMEINKNLTLRGEFGKGSGNDFVLAGVQYRFGL